MTYNEYLQSNHWKRLKEQKFLFSGEMCNRCLRKDVQLEVHHVYYRKSWWECKVEDLEVLCTDCHKKAHNIPTFTEKQKKPRARNVNAFMNPYRYNGHITARY